MSHRTPAYLERLESRIVMSAGAPDATFAGDGGTTVSFGGSEQFFAVARQADGKLVAVGGTGDVLYGTRAVMARFNANGSLDGTFGSGGKVSFDFDTSFNDCAKSVIIQPDGRIVVGGSTGHGSSGRTFVARVLTNGALDSSFSSNGFEFYGGRNTTNDDARFAYFGNADIALQDDPTT